MSKPVCRVINLQASSLSGFVSEIDAIAAGGRSLSPDSSGYFDAAGAHDLCVACVNCGTVASGTELCSPLCCSDCGMEDFHVIQTVAPPPRRPSYDPLPPPHVPRPPAPKTTLDESGEQTSFSPWARWAARSLDIVISCMLGGTAVGFVLGFLGCDVDNMSDTGWLVLAAVPAMALDALCYNFFGWTLGKWLFAVKVSHQDGTQLSFTEYFKRNLWMLVKGQGLMLPIVTLVMQVIQYNRVKSGKPASYDEGKDVRIVRVRHDVIRTVIGVILLILVSVVLAALQS